MRAVLKYFFQGILVLVPTVATIYVFYVIFEKLDGLVFARLGAKVSELLDWDVAEIVGSGLGILATFLLITVVGVFSSNVLGRGFLRLVDALFERVPLVKLLYGSLKDLLGAFVGDQKSFEKPVLVSVAPGTRVVGFVTQESLELLGRAGDVAVYLPQSYNFAGNLLIVDRAQVEAIESESSKVMKFLVSGGVSS